MPPDASGAGDRAATAAAPKGGAGWVASGLPIAYPGREVLAANLAATSLLFEVTPPTLQRGAVVSFRLVLEDTDTGESTSISQEVQIRNVP